MKSQLVRPPVADLVFQLHGRPLHPEFFEVRAYRRVTRPEFVLSVRITSTGHVITWENADVVLTEVTAAAAEDLPASRRLLHHKLRQERSVRLPCAHGVVYQASYQVEHLRPDHFDIVHDEIIADGRKRGMIHSFPPAEEGAELPPLGFVTAEFRPGCLFLASFHTFPEEFTVVKTQSLVEYVPGA